MLCELPVRAYAKVNFGLNVLPLQTSGVNAGFHNIESIFQTVDLFDELVVTKQAGNVKTCTVCCDSMELPEENTLTLAFRAFSEVTGKNDFGIHVQLNKGIPSGGGLGGGSSDGASLIKVLESLYNIKLTESQLSEIAAKIGSDVFFFTRCNENGTGCALVSGRGEIVKNIQGRTDLFLLLVFPGVSSSTKTAYSLIDEMYERSEVPLSPDFSCYEEIYRGNPASWSFINTFTPVISKEYPEIASALKCVRESGAVYSEVSGSGSTVFGVFTCEQQAETAKSLLGDKWSCKVCRTL
ncbi:MAG: 4-(cytidine 5'-diphospho)-2-C-methyl-D-erythritol kinase [Treponema sp.]|nr:4-(cytidine 5'-diphospho)-2-C-methyl-D-erythritol kinase [Treponema sp.]